MSRAGSGVPGMPFTGPSEVTELQPLADQPLAATQHQAWEATPEPSAGDGPDGDLSMATGGSVRAASPTPGPAEDSGMLKMSSVVVAAHAVLLVSNGVCLCCNIVRVESPSSAHVHQTMAWQRSGGA